MSMENPPLPPPVLPPPPPPPPPTALGPSSSGKKKLYQAIAEGKAPVQGDYEEALCLLRQRESGYRKDLQWLLLNKYVPSLIQDGPQCGLVALWMASQLLQPPKGISMDTIVHKARTKGYTVQGEMFSARDMAFLAEEVCGCKAEYLQGGMKGTNTALILKHLLEGQPVLVPYDEDFNHEPCQRSGHRAHWAVISGVMVGLTMSSLDSMQVKPDDTLPWVFTPQEGVSPTWSMDSMQEVYVLAKQGKSLKYQLWDLGVVAESNIQLRELDPKRENDGSSYVLPSGGVEAGLAGQAVMLHTKTSAC
ncbi:actin maturation protease isoform X2 [Engraulis encrasicolus]|uniref:actin maturation protease isoform X2 n=1 Tax=Engraulis encrasicolus TaxID=184585 RepID=UPI002FCFFD87